MRRFESIFTKTKLYLDNSAFWAEVEYAWKRFINIVFRTPWHWFRCNFIPKHRYHILDLRKGGNNYSWGWYDTDSRMLQACFLLLKEYVEKEQPFNNADWNWNEDHKHAGEEIKYLYEWWTVKRPEAKAKLAYDWEHEPYDTHFIKLPDGGYKIMQPESVRTLVQREDDMSAEDQRNLERLIKIRGFLWT